MSEAPTLEDMDDYAKAGQYLMQQALGTWFDGLALRAVKTLMDCSYEDRTQSLGRFQQAKGG